MPFCPFTVHEQQRKCTILMDNAKAQVADNELWPMMPSTHVRGHEQQGKITNHEDDAKARVVDDMLLLSSLFTICELHGETTILEDDSKAIVVNNEL